MFVVLFTASGCFLSSHPAAVWCRRWTSSLRAHRAAAALRTGFNVIKCQSRASDEQSCGGVDSETTDLNLTPWQWGESSFIITVRLLQEAGCKASETGRGFKIRVWGHIKMKSSSLTVSSSSDGSEAFLFVSSESIRAVHFLFLCASSNSCSASLCFYHHK